VTEATLLAIILLLPIGLVGVSAQLLIHKMNDRARREGTYYRQCERTYGYIIDFFFDNPQIGESEVIRRALLPTDAELAILQLDPGFEQDLREMREGTSWLLKGGARAGSPSLAIQNVSNTTSGGKGARS
jgi:hypothetical protein